MNFPENTIVVEVQARVLRGTAAPEAFGWKITIGTHEPADQIAAAVTEACRRVRNETQERLK